MSLTEREVFAKARLATAAGTLIEKILRFSGAAAPSAAEITEDDEQVDDAFRDAFGSQRIATSPAELDS